MGESGDWDIFAIFKFMSKISEDRGRPRYGAPMLQFASNHTGMKYDKKNCFKLELNYLHYMYKIEDFSNIYQTLRLLNNISPRACDGNKSPRVVEKHIQGGAVIPF